jgi:hypothetical protein
VVSFCPATTLSPPPKRHSPLSFYTQRQRPQGHQTVPQRFIAGAPLRVWGGGDKGAHVDGVPEVRGGKEGAEEEDGEGRAVSLVGVFACFYQPPPSFSSFYRAFSAFLLSF